MHIFNLFHRNKLLTVDNVRKCKTPAQLQQWPFTQVQSFIRTMFETKNHSMIHHLLRYFPEHPTLAEQWKKHQCSYEYMSTYDSNVIRNLPKIPAFIIEDWLEYTQTFFSADRFTLTEIRVIANIGAFMAQYKEQFLTDSMLPRIPDIYLSTMISESPDLIYTFYKRNIPITRDMIESYNNALFARRQFDISARKFLTLNSPFSGFCMAQNVYSLSNIEPLVNAIHQFKFALAQDIQPWTHTYINTDIQLMLHAMCEWVNAQDTWPSVFNPMMVEAMLGQNFSIVCNNEHLMFQWGPYYFGNTSLIEKVLNHSSLAQYQVFVNNRADTISLIHSFFPYLASITTAEYTLFPDKKVSDMIFHHNGIAEEPLWI